MVTTLTLIIVAYLIGAIPFGLIVARMFGVTDIRKEGSGNIGATNVYRIVGVRAAVWVYLLDISKGLGMVLAAAQFEPTWLSKNLFLVLVALAAVLGHVFPIYLKFKGGKGVNTAFGGLLVLMPAETLVAVLVFIIATILTRYISLGSICGTLALPAALLLERLALNRPIANVYLYLSLILAALVLVTHRRNIRRLLSGTENRFSFSTRASKAGSRA